MSVTVVYQNVFDVQAQATVVTVNCGGVMGKGCAEVCKRKYPMIYLDYRRRCMRGLVKVGRVSNEDIYQQPDGRYIILLPTKDIWQNNSQLSWVETGLAELMNHCLRLNLDTIAIPPPGCGNGGLNFEEEVKPVINELFDAQDIEVTVCI